MIHVFGLVAAWPSDQILTNSLPFTNIYFNFIHYKFLKFHWHKWLYFYFFTFSLREIHLIYNNQIQMRTICACLTANSIFHRPIGKEQDQEILCKYVSGRSQGHSWISVWSMNECAALQSRFLAIYPFLSIRISLVHELITF